MKNSVDPTVLSLHLKTRYLHKIIENSTPDGECIMWDKSLNTSGYPQMRFCFPGSNLCTLCVCSDVYRRVQND